LRYICGNNIEGKWFNDNLNGNRVKEIVLGFGQILWQGKIVEGRIS